jgi:hypothetical protein
MNKNTLISLILYFVGLICLALLDIFVSNRYDEVFISEWAFIKSTILILGSICLLGYDQVFIRDTSLIKRVFKKFVIQSVLISFISAVVIAQIKKYDIANTSLLFLSLISMSFLNYYSAASRALYNLWQSQFYTNLWKIILLLIIILNIFDNVFKFYIVALVLSILFSFIVKGYDEKENIIENKIVDKDARNLGLSFLFTNFSLIFAVYGEQFLINLYGSAQISATLFSYFSILTPISLSLNGFIGFYLAPKIKKERTMDLHSYKNLSIKIFILTLLVTSLSIFIGLIYMLNFQGFNIEGVNWVLVFSLMILCIIRGVYISTSVCLGVFGNPKILRSSAFYMSCSTGFYILTIFLVLYFVDGINAVIFISLLSTFNWFSRLLISNFYTIKTLRSI